MRYDSAHKADCMNPETRSPAESHHTTSSNLYAKNT